MREQMQMYDNWNEPSRSWTPPEALRELEAAGCTGVVSELVEDFKSDTSQRLMRLRKAVVESDAATFRREAHSIKGSAAQMGASDVAALARVLEVEGTSMPAWAVQASVEKLAVQVEVLCRTMTEYTESQPR
jgi:HPt (histidine-containing phosphotransfer) domain-containing protein